MSSDLALPLPATADVQMWIFGWSEFLNGMTGRLAPPTIPALGSFFKAPEVSSGPMMSQDHLELAKKPWGHITCFRKSGSQCPEPGLQVAEQDPTLHKDSAQNQTIWVSSLVNL